MNVSLLVQKQVNAHQYCHSFCTAIVSDKGATSSKAGESSYIFPLYTLRQRAISVEHPGAGTQDEGAVFAPNFHQEVYQNICSHLGEEVEPLSLFDYIYATLHCPSYRERYAEQLRIGFPRIPYPTKPETFHQLAELGEKLRLLHLMHDSDRWPLSSTFPVSGDNPIEKVLWRIEDGEGRVYINATQYFGGITESMWSYPIGSYRPMQKWLKDRKGCRLDWDGIRHYMRVAYAVRESLAIMAKIESVWTPPV